MRLNRVFYGVVYGAILLFLGVTGMFCLAFAQEQRTQRPGAVRPSSPSRTLKKSLPPKRKIIPSRTPTPTNIPPQDEEEEENDDEQEHTPLSYPIKDRRYNYWEHDEWNSFMRLEERNILHQERAYDPATRSVLIGEQVGNLPFRLPMLYDETTFRVRQDKKNQATYFQNLLF